MAYLRVVFSYITTPSVKVSEWNWEIACQKHLQLECTDSHQQTSTVSLNSLLTLWPLTSKLKSIFLKKVPTSTTAAVETLKESNLQ